MISDIKKSSILFPNPEEFSSPEGLVYVGGSMDAPTLLNAYQNGIFPWPHENYPWLWFSPPERGILEFREIHIQKSLKKFRKNHSHWTWTLNKNFKGVMIECQKQTRPGQLGTWIFDEMIPAYSDLCEQGAALSLEVWAPTSSSQEMVAGIYGVLLPNYFSAESMFYKKSNASKLAFWLLIEELQKRGYFWMDLQMVTPVTKSFGAKLISRKDFLKKVTVPFSLRTAK